MIDNQENGPRKKTPPRGRFQMTLGKVPLIIMLVILLVTATVVHLSWQYAYQRSVGDLTRKLNTRVISKITTRVDTLLEHASINIMDIHELFLKGVVDHTNTESREGLFLTMIQFNPIFSWITFGFPNGDFFGAQRRGPGEFRFVDRTWNPETNLARSENRFYQRNGDTLMLTHTAIDEVRYFAPDRAWYRDAIRSEGKVWTDVYIYASSQKPGIDVAIPIEKNGQIIGVVAIGMELGQISEYLGGMSVGKAGISFIINGKSELIAYRDVAEVVVTGQVGDAPQLRSLSASRAPLLQIATQATASWNLAGIQVETQKTMTAEDSKLPAQYLGKEFLVTLAPLGHEDWLIGTVIPTAEFKAEVDTIQRQLLVFITLAILLLSAVTFALTRAFLTSPLQTITTLMSQVGRCDERESITPVSSPFLEIQQLSQVMKQMGQDLCAMRAKERNLAETKLNQEHSLTRLNQVMRKADDVATLCREGLSFLVQALDAQVGAVYLLEEKSQLRLHAGYALHPAHPPLERFNLGEGWLGQAVVEKEMKVLPGHLADGFAIHAGTQDVLANALAALPMIQNEQARGVLVLSNVQPFSDTQLGFAQRVSNTITVAIDGIQSNIQTRELLDKTRKQAEELTAHQRVLDETITQLEQASGHKSRFLASMSHELRSPLNSLLILSKLLSENKQGNLTEKQVEFAQTIHSAGSDLLALIDEILDLARIEAGRIRIFRDSVKLTELADSLEKLFRHVARDKGLEFQVLLKGILPVSLHTDRQRVEQILKNLLSNAIKFTEKGGIEVVFQAHEPDRTVSGEDWGTTDWVAVTVSDTGIGIPEEKQAVIFEPFRQVDDSTNRKYGGTGLGLAICRELATLLAGRIDLKSREGAGSTFTVYLPITEAPEEKPAAEAEGTGESKVSPADRAGGLETIRDDRRSLGPQDRCVLVIGTDHERIRQQNDIAREAGLGVIVAGDQGAALFLANYYQPMAAVMAGDLPGVEAAGMVERIRAAVHLQELPVLYLVPQGAQPVGTDVETALCVVPMAAGPAQIVAESTRFLEEVIAGISGREQKPEEERTAPALMPETPERPDAAISLQDRRILIVEDDMRNVFALTSLLEERGANVSMAENGRVGLKKIEEGPELDVVLLDIMMPDMNGYEVLKEVRKNPDHRNLPIIVLTAKALQGERQRCLDVGASDYLPKPVDPPKLLSMLSIWLGQRS